MAKTETATDTNNQNLLSQTYDQIVNDMLKGTVKYAQLLGKPETFNWAVAPTGQLSPQAYQFMSAAPPYSAVGDFGGVGTSTLFSNYKQIFAHVGFVSSPEIQKQIQDLSNQAQTQQNNIDKAWADANTAYNTSVQNGGAIFKAKFPDINAWLAGPGESYQKRADTAQQQADSILEQIQQLNEANQPTSLKDALALIKTPTGSPSSGNAPRGWAIVPDGAGVLRWQPSFTIATDSQDWRNQLTSGSIGQSTITLDASKSDSSINKSWAGADVSYGNPFWGVYASGSWEQTNISESDNSVTATVSVKSSTVVKITPDAWYDGGFLKQMVAAGNSGTGYSILSPYTVSGGDHALFGKGGLCSTMVNGLIVVYQPSFSVEMASSTYESFEQKISASAGFRIGPFSFGGHGGHYEKDVSTTGNRTKFTGGSTSTDPVIIGVTVGFPGTEKP